MPRDLQTTSEKYCSIWALYLICCGHGVSVVTNGNSAQQCVLSVAHQIERKVTIFPQNCAQNDAKDEYSVSFSDLVFLPRNDKEGRFASAVLVRALDSGQ